ncbi:non-canonical purine NTP diphosphatase [Jiulongibacter sediminis]|uniref:dITP/XTP pyrophosphatase n=1 Tax=Jiulongibacter sediminis TaxID=1605367 RepID=A0A0P7BUE5_9BACT|nr:non-canonical purine NTP diphosphatase [Jiulongibacter sediminis]KPM48374.1 deoxyribonucleotide triphosphate pyrophosphatase [Jiulongibacter sediminis]TBX24912.1 deoxyribonucleotide triphosphate pyrophosphatase [Jiulongibacter sediminis]
MKTICLATNNLHKVEELQQMLGGLFEIKTLKDIGCTEDIAETADNFSGNSLIKAEYVYKTYGIDCIADDSGLEVDALNGEPGVYSARYAGEHGNHEKNMDKLLENLRGIENRSARFKTVVTLILDGKKQSFEGTVEGQIIDRKKGDGGFGYDPVFRPDGYDRTFAEMSMEEKNPISHRGRAIEKLKGYLLENAE